jgi:hypothetical protein
MRTELLSLLTGDATLTALLTGGVYDGVEVDHISRTTTPDAFDADSELLPCLLVRLSGEEPFGIYPLGSQVAITLYLYQLFGSAVIDQARERCFRLLHRVYLPGVRGWWVEHTGDLLGQWDAALDCPLIVSRYRFLRHRVPTEPGGEPGRLDFSAAAQSSLVGVV